MTRADFNNIIEIIDLLEKQEKEYCEGYIKLNPDDRKRRQNISDNIISGMHRVTSEIYRQYKNRLE